MKLDTKLYEKDTDTIIKREKCYILAFEYINKSLDGLRCDFDEYQDI